MFEIVKVAPRAIAYTVKHTTKALLSFSAFRSTHRGITKTSQNGENGDKLVGEVFAPRRKYTSLT